MKSQLNKVTFQGIKNSGRDRGIMCEKRAHKNAFSCARSQNESLELVFLMHISLNEAE